MDLFKKTMVVCAAISSFAGGAYLLSSGAETEALKRVSAYLADLQQKSTSVEVVSGDSK